MTIIGGDTRFQPSQTADCAIMEQTVIINVNLTLGLTWSRGPAAALTAALLRLDGQTWTALQQPITAAPVTSPVNSMNITKQHGAGRGERVIALSGTVWNNKALMKL